MSDDKKKTYEDGQSDGFWKGVGTTFAALATAIVAIIAGSKKL